MEGWVWLGILGLLCVLIYIHYPKIQMHYNPQLLDPYTPDSQFPIQEGSESYVKDTTKLGYEVASQSSAVFCIMLRDVEERIPSIIQRAERTGKMFKKAAFLVVENDSSDRTRELLLKWKERNPNVTVLGCGVNAPGKCEMKMMRTIGHDVNPSRIQKMVDLRNIYLDYVKSHFSDYDFCCMWDLDIIGSLYIDGVAHTLGEMSKSPNINVVCANGLNKLGVVTYYDGYAHLEKGDDFHVDNKVSHAVKTKWNVQHQRGERLHPVTSCFSGFAIYKISSLLPKNVRYDMSPDGSLECEHVRLHKKMSGVYMNPNMIHFVLIND